MEFIVGFQLKINMMDGVPTRTKNNSDYTGFPIPPCGDFAGSMSSPSESTTAPWLQNNSVLVGGSYSLSLHQEIELFMAYMAPTPQEIATRKDLVTRFTTLIAPSGAEVTVKPVGSYVTGLYTPTSDIDMVLVAPQAQAQVRSYSSSSSSLGSIYYKILGSNFASKLEDVRRASVPLIRITDKKSGIEIDLTAADRHGINATRAVQKWLKYDTELVKILILIVKTFLAIRRCGTTYTGGINSYVLVWMVVAWVKLEWPKINGTSPISRSRDDYNDDISSLSGALERLSVGQRGPAMSLPRPIPLPTATVPPQAESSTPDYAKALKGFLKFYGQTFDYNNQAIEIEPTPRYKPKRNVYSRYTTQRYLLSIFDPANASIDMGEKAYGIKHVQATFMEAYILLKTQAGRQGLLGAMLDGDFTKFIEKRNKLARLVVQT